MNSVLNAYITLICVSSVLNLYLCFYAFTKRQNFTNIAYYFISYTGTIAVYCISTAFYLLSTTIEEIKFWTVMEYIGMPVSVPLGLLFIMQYLGIRVSKRRVAALLVIPLISFLMVATNDLHHLHYRIYELDPVLGAPYVYQVAGSWYIIHGLFTFGCMFGAFLLLCSRWKETAKVYRPQLIALMFGQLVPMVTAFLYLMGFTPAGVDPVPMVLWISSLLYLWAIQSSRLFTIMPIAKEAIFNGINDGVIALDETNRVIEFNDAFTKMFPQLQQSLYGTSFQNVWADLGDGTAFPLNQEERSFDHELYQPAADDVPERFIHVRTASIRHTNSKGLLVIFTDITELKQLQKKLKHQANHDELTHLYNRRAFFEQAERQFVAAKKAATPFSVILMDIDNFKKVNDTYGHAFGDQVLLHVATICRMEFTTGEVFARYGGEEFAVALNGYTLPEGARLANQLRNSLERHPLLKEELAITITLSLGVAEMTGSQEETLRELLNKADQALYRAKEGGRNQVQVYAELEEAFA